MAKPSDADGLASKTATLYKALYQLNLAGIATGEQLWKELEKVQNLTIADSDAFKVRLKLVDNLDLRRRMPLGVRLLLFPKALRK